MESQLVKFFKFEPNISTLQSFDFSVKLDVN